MKKTITLFNIWVIILSAVDLSANIDNLSNMSAEWIRTGNRNAATDAADIVIYNPAGLTELKDGLVINIGNQSLFREPTHRFSTGTGVRNHEQDKGDLFIPNIYAAYKDDDWSVFGGFYIPGGGAVVDYPDGSITTYRIGSQIVQESYGLVAQMEVLGMVPPGTSQLPGLFEFYHEFLEASSAYYTFTLGSAYKINDLISIAAGIRYINANNTIEAGLKLKNNLDGSRMRFQVDIEDTADGFGWILGVNINPSKKLNIGIHYETRVILGLETEVNKDDLGLFVDGEKKRRDFPGMIGIGVGYDFSQKLYGEFNTSYWFQEECDWGRDPETGREFSDMAGDAFSFGCTFSYLVSKSFLFSIGATYTEFMWNDMKKYYTGNLGAYEVLYSDNWHFGTGFAYDITDHIKFNFAIGRTIWDDVDFRDRELDNMVLNTENKTTALALGLEFCY